VSKLNNIFLGSVSVLAFGAFATPALAQSAAADQTVETVVVTGIRGEMHSAQEIKQNSDVFVDSISAEDIGALPDRSVVESIQRIPGVAINKFMASADPDHFSAEGSGVVVRGLTYVRSELNGEDTFSANGGRELSFADIPSELLSGVDVFKSPSSDMIEGGISGTVNLKTRMPFDSPGPVLAGSLQAAYADLADKTTPSGSVLASDRWTVPFGEIGLLGAYVNSDTRSRSDNAQSDYFVCVKNLGNTSANCPTSFGGGQGAWFPSGANMATQTFDRKRVGYDAALQWQSNDGTMNASLSFLQSNTQESSEEDRIELASDNVNASGEPGPLPVAGTNFGFNNQGVFTNGTITGQTGWRADGNYDWLQNDCSDSACDPRTPYWGVETNNHHRNILAKYMTNNLGFKFQWTPNDTWAFNVDLQHVESTTHDLDAQIDGATFVSTQLSLPSDGSLPSFKFLPPATPEAVPTTVSGATFTPTVIPGNDECLPGGGPGLAPRPQEPNPPGNTFATQTTCNTFMGYGHTSYADPYNTFWRDAMDHMEHSDAIESSGKLDVDYKVNGDWLSLIRAGVRWSQREEVNRSTTYNWGVLSEQWGNGGPVWMDDPVDGIPNGSGATLGTPIGGGAPPFQDEKQVAFNNYFRGRIAPPNSSPFLFSSINGARNYAQYSAFASEVEAEWNPNAPTGGAGGWIPLAARPGTCDSSGMVGGVKVPGCEAGYLPGEVSPSTEISQSAFLMFKFGHSTWGDQSFDGNIGLRYIGTQHETEGAVQFPINNLPIPGVSSTVNSRGCLPPTTPPAAGAPPFTPPAFCALSAADQATAEAFSNGAFGLTTLRTSYDYVLPSMNVKYNLTDDMLIRFGASEAISRPPMGETAFSATVGVAPDTLPNVACPGGATTCPGQFGGFNSGSAQTGNPFLKPVRAVNLDLSYEWYFAPTGSLTVAGFAKELHNVITQQTTNVNISNNGATEPVLVTTPVNSASVGKVKGFEVAYQQFADFLPAPFDGLGVNANFTYIDSQGVAQNVFNLLTASGAQSVNSAINLAKLPLEQLSRYNYNIQGIYEKGDISARLAYTWRSSFLLTAYDVIVPHSPIMNAATGQLDGSLFYTIDDHFKIGIEGTNLLDSVVRTEQVLTTSPTLLAPRSWFITDRTFTLTLRANL
jgi:TonB-dependent receptor